MKYGLIGEKLGHSFSPQIHKALGCAAYQLIPLDKEQFYTFMENKDFQAINVTIPYKEAVFPYCEQISEKAKKIGAINTVKTMRTEAGKKILCGDNTDFDGFLYLLEKHDISIINKVVMILGTGGTCKTVTAVANHLKAKKILTVSRKAEPGFFDYTQCQKEKDVQVIINTTPVGMYPNVGQCQIDLANYPNLEAVVDVIFNPLETKLLQEARKQGVKGVNGLEMLVAQAKAAEEIFFDKKIADREIDIIYRQLKKEISNISFIGMPGCGKTTIAKALAEKLQKTVVDTDALIVEKTHMPIAEIFAQYGEDYFRSLEQQVIAEVSKEHGQIIATGGGIIKKQENIDLLKQNGMVIFIDRPLDSLEIGNGRPLSANQQAVAALYQERYQLYKAACDMEIKNQTTIEHAVAEILKRWEAGI